MTVNLSASRKEYINLRDLLDARIIRFNKKNPPSESSIFLNQIGKISFEIST